MPFTYGELQVEMDMINRAYIEVMTKGDAKGRVFTFPIPTYNMNARFPVGIGNATRLFRDDRRNTACRIPELYQFRPQAEHGALDVLPPAARFARALKRGNGLFGSASRPARWAWSRSTVPASATFYQGNEEALLMRLDELAGDRQNSLEIKRKVIQRHMDAGLFPYTRRTSAHCATTSRRFGVNGINEMIRNFTHDEHESPASGATSSRCGLLDMCAPRCSRSRTRPATCTPEATPAEGTTLPFRQGRPQAFRPT